MQCRVGVILSPHPVGEKQMLRIKSHWVEYVVPNRWDTRIALYKPKLASISEMDDVQKTMRMKSFQILQKKQKWN